MVTTERSREIKKKSYYKDHERTKALKMAYADRYPERIAEWNRKWLNKEGVQERRNAYRKAWRKKNKVYLNLQKRIERKFGVNLPLDEIRHKYNTYFKEIQELTK